MNIILAILALLVIMSLSSHIVLWDRFKYYKYYYERLPYMKFYICGSNQLIYGVLDGTSIFNSFIWFRELNDFKLANNIYLHSTIVSYFSPYSIYYLIKYRNWLKANVNIDKLEKYDMENERKFFTNIITAQDLWHQ